ncbi:MAG: DUF374 domain-containing protein [Gemmatimonadales bacterium]|nr:MAG: DUF374 domain-containing protein [Gemmatimonadales bacterium]
MTPPEWKLRSVELGGSAILTLLGGSWRFELRGEEHIRRLRESGTPFIFAFWHAQLLPLAHHHRNEGIVVLVSQHKDGEYIARVIERRGFETVRGSSTRGGVQGLKGLIRAARSGHDLGITPDGPRGPACEVKRGALIAAQLSGLPILPMAAGASRAWRLNSWDRFMIPSPFSRIRIHYGPPLSVPREADDADLTALASRLEDEINRLTAEAGARE